MQPHHLWIAGILAILCGPAFTSSSPSQAASQASHEKVIYTFQGPDGDGPQSDLTLDAKGNLYGTTAGGGTYGYGTVFELKRTADGWKEEVLYSFTGGSDGLYPEAGVIFDSAGNLYGTTFGNPRECGQGNVFELTPSAKGVWSEKVLYSFSCPEGNPNLDLVLDSHGNLFGTVADIVFKLIPRSRGPWTEVTLHAFDDLPGGVGPSSAPVLDSSGNVWGTTSAGGTGKCEYYRFAGGCGLVYELVRIPDGKWNETMVYNFARGGGRAVTPSTGLMLKSDDRIVGTTVAGGDGIGAVFELKKSQGGWRQDVLYRFYGSPDGQKPVGQLETGSSGAMFGVTYGGGKNSLGTVFELDPRCDHQ